MRTAGIRSTFLLIAALMVGQAAQAQWCPNSPSASSSVTCSGQNSLASVIAGGCCGTGSADTGVGFDSLMHDTTGAENTGIGAYALYWTSTSSYNTAVGYTALMSNQTGSGNTAVGAQALENSTTASNNTAVGYTALMSNQTGAGNTAVGTQALEVSTTAVDNTAMGFQALNVDSSGYENTAVGSVAMDFNQTGTENSALGYGALYSNVSGSSNTAIGGSALSSLTNGSSNLALGVNAGQNYTGAESNNVTLATLGTAGESGVIRIGTGGTQTKAFIAGIYGATSASGTWVMVNSSGQLGTTSSSRRFKQEVADMGTASDDLMRLRPVTFRYKPQYDDGQGVLQYGLIAEEVAAVNPGLVQFGEDGQPLAVRYHFVGAMLLNEVQQQHATIASQAARLAEQAEKLDRQAAEIARQQAAIEELAARLARLEGR